MLYTLYRTHRQRSGPYCDLRIKGYTFSLNMNYIGSVVEIAKSNRLAEDVGAKKKITDWSCVNITITKFKLPWDQCYHQTLHTMYSYNDQNVNLEILRSK